MVKFCENCGKEIDETKLGKYSSGRFCSKSCANVRHHSEDVKIKISNSVIEYNKNHPESVTNRVATYCKNLTEGKYKKKSNSNTLEDRVCNNCGNKFLVSSRSSKKYCSYSCRIEALRKSASKQERHGAASKGKYKGTQCDSKLELAFLIYCLEHNINIKRCVESFEYSWKGKQHLYTPDFKLRDKIYVEIKGWNCTINKIKLAAVQKTGEVIYILYAHDLQKCINYVREKYNVKNYDLDSLYDEKDYTKTCAVCGKIFHSRNAKQLTCSNSCNGKYQAQKIWIMKDGTRRHVLSMDLPEYLNNGWYKVKPVGKGLGSKGGWNWIKYE